MEILAKFFKADESRNEVHGVMAEEAPDKSGEIFDYATSKPYVQAWAAERLAATGGKSYGNVRGQHSGKVAAGKLLSIGFDDQRKIIPIIAKIVDPGEWEKVVQGVYSGFSIGGSYVRKWSDGRATRYTAKPSEVSLVDVPCMPGAVFTLVKANGTTEFRPLTGGGSETPRQQPALKFVPGGVDRPEVALEELAKARGNRWPIDRPRPFYTR
ncbi:MAG TPA: hypothetical protein VJN93_13565 [Candidatus Acidoferrum sp.]|nr:hypothetical protein [Candidatus Acidoferrum sp.]